MDGKLTPPDLMEKTMVMSDVNEDRSPERRAFLFRYTGRLHNMPNRYSLNNMPQLLTKI
jgi:hypothetical protein